MKKLFILSSVLFSLSSLFSQTCFIENRYQKAIFDSVVITKNITYAVAPQLVPTEVLGGVKTYDETKFEDIELQMDIYQPYGDTLSKRPMIIFMHSGGFLPDYGDRHNDDMIAFCDTFARKGYVTATISYRLGYDILDSVAATRAVYRAIQDGRSAIRFLKEKATVYNIDTANIFMLGSSAGAFIALHNAYLNEESERPEETYGNSDHPDLKGLDSTGNTFLHPARAKAIVSLWGALKDTALILPSDIRPTLLIHGIDDESVYFEYDHPFGLSTLPKVYGSHPIYKKLKKMGYDAPHYFVPEEDHEFYGIDNGKWEDDAPNAYWDTVLTSVTSFIYEQLPKPKASFTYNHDNCQIHFDNQSESQIANCWDFGDTHYSSDYEPTHSYASVDSFLVTLSIINYLGIMDNQTQSILSTACTDAIDNYSRSQQIQLYPNPASHTIFIHSGKIGSTTVSIHDITGKTLQRHLFKVSSFSLDISMLDKGIYFISVDTKTAHKQFKLVKE